MRTIHVTGAVAVALLVTLSGCQRGPALGTVSGVVQVNGKPLPYAYVVFQPIDPPGAYGSAYADENGKYELQFSKHRNGAPVGSHRVSIRAAGRDELPDDAPPTVRVQLPAKYNSATELVRKVEPGHNDHDFNLAVPITVSSIR